jgi:hypothetical protein
MLIVNVHAYEAFGQLHLSVQVLSETSPADRSTSSLSSSYCAIPDPDQQPSDSDVLESLAEELWNVAAGWRRTGSGDRRASLSPRT